MSVSRLIRDLFHGHEQLRFLVVGAWNTAFGYFAFVGLYLLWVDHLHYLAIMVLAHLVAVVNAFVGHRWLVFRSRGPLLVEFLRFNLSYLGLLAFGMLAMPLLVEAAHLHVLVAQALLTVVTVVTSYFVHRHFSFRSAG